MSFVLILTRPPYAVKNWPENAKKKEKKPNNQKTKRKKNCAAGQSTDRHSESQSRGRKKKLKSENGRCSREAHPRLCLYAEVFRI